MKEQVKSRSSGETRRVRLRQVCNDHKRIAGTLSNNRVRRVRANRLIILHVLRCTNPHRSEKDRGFRPVKRRARNRSCSTNAQSREEHRGIDADSGSQQRPQTCFGDRDLKRLQRALVSNRAAEDPTSSAVVDDRARRPQGAAGPAEHCQCRSQRDDHGARGFGHGDRHDSARPLRLRIL